MELTSLDRLFWVTGFAANIVLFVVLVVKRKVRTFPLFSALIAFNIVRSVYLHHEQTLGYYAYFYAYWELAAVDTLLQLLVFGEVAARIFRPTGRLSSDVRRPLILIALFSICLGLILVWLAAPIAADLDTQFVLRLELFSTFLMAEIFAGLTLLSVTSGFVWKSQVGIITRGLGFFSVFSLLMQGVQNYFGPKEHSVLFTATSRLQIVCYLLCLSYWTAGLAKSAPATRPMTDDLKVQLTKLDSYMSSALAQLRFGRISS